VGSSPASPTIPKSGNLQKYRENPKITQPSSLKPIFGREGDVTPNHSRVTVRMPKITLDVYAGRKICRPHPTGKCILYLLCCLKKPEC
jgi:hypothetical protein